MIFVSLLLTFLAVFAGIMAFSPVALEEERPTLVDFGLASQQPVKPREAFWKKIAPINKPFVAGSRGRQLNRDLSLAYVKWTPEEFFLIKELLFVALLSAAFFLPQDMRLMGIAAAVIFGFQGLEFWLKSKIRKVKARIIKELPDVVDLLALCVNAGLDFMLSLKWVVEKSQPSAMIDQLNTLLQEINVGKPRRDALRDLARRFDLPDLSTFSRTLIMADKMGTSMSDALNSLSIDMRYARYRRGEAMAMKAPIKLLIPLIFCIFPVVLILVAGPLFLQFMKLDVVQMSQPTKNSQTK